MANEVPVLGITSQTGAQQVLVTSEDSSQTLFNIADDTETPVLLEEGCSVIFLSSGTLLSS
jgi:hypothetical protein